MKSPTLKVSDVLDDWPIFTIEISHSNKFLFGTLLFRLLSHCKKIFLDSAESSTALVVMAGYSYWLCEAKNKHKSLWSDQTRQHKPLNKHFREHCCWSNTMVYRSCRDVETNSYPPDSKVRGANMGPTWVLSAPDGPHVSPTNLAIKVTTSPIHWTSTHGQ